MKPMHVLLCSVALILASIAFSFAMAWLAHQDGWWVDPAAIWAALLLAVCGFGGVAIWGLAEVGDDD